MYQLTQVIHYELSVRCWYTRREGVTRGPFTAEDISRYILLGRIRLDDEVSRNRETWIIAGAYTDLLPDELRSQSCWNEYQRLVIAHMKADERKGERRSLDGGNYLDSHAERRISLERRRETENSLLHYYLCSDAVSTGRKHPDARHLRPLLLATLLAALVLIWLNPARY